jgi:glycosyltransferase involved in cell wall biosynthesis
MMISVIIATRDRAPLLATTLDAVAGQQSPGCAFEILVVDNASADGTPAVVRTAAAGAGVPMTYLREERPGKSHALNTGVTHARGDLLVFTDDDVLPSRGWLAAFVRAVHETRADFATGRILPLWEAPPPRWMSPALHGALSIADGGPERLALSKGLNEQITPMGGNLAVRRSITDRIGGWNPALGKRQGTLRSAEDHEFALRMFAAGFTGVYEPDAVVRHRVPADRLRRAYFQRWFYDNGVIVAGLEQNYPSTDRYVLKVPRYRWRRAFVDLGSTIRAIVTADPKRATAGHMRLVWFAGYLRARWKRPTPSDSAQHQVRAAALPRS